MPEGEQANGNAKKADGNHNSALDAGLWWIVVAGVLGLLVLLFVSVFLPNLTERAKFFTANVLSLLVLGVITVQAYIYRKQWEVMQRQLENARVNERAYIGIKRIETENQQIGSSPNVRLTIINGGRTPAYGVKAPGHMTITRDGLSFPHERPEVSKQGNGTFLPAGSPITFNYPFIIPWTEQWAKEIQSERYFIYLHVEIHFDDVWGEKQFMTFKLAYRARDNRWGSYKDKSESEPVLTIT